MDQNVKAILSYPGWIKRRELGQQLPIGYSDIFYKKLYSSISPCHYWSGGENSRSVHGGIYSLEFSPDGSVLVAGCEKNSYMMFDPVSRKLICSIYNAHSSAITNVKFLDSSIFATGSVDKTVSIWDARNLRTRLRTVSVHSNSIGNLAFSQKNNLLIASGLDGFISTWDIKTFVKKREICRKISWSYVLTRMRLTPDETKMILSTGRGFLMIVHNLDLTTLSLDDFELDLFGLSYLHQANISRFLNWSPFLTPNRRTNRVEIVWDYPNPVPGGVHVISSLEIHPRGWSALTRSKCIAKGQRTHWTCAHDITEKPPAESEGAPRGGRGDERPLGPLQEADSDEEAAAAGRAAGPSRSEAAGAASAEGQRARRRRDSSRGLEVPAVLPARPISAPPGPLEGAGAGGNPASRHLLDPPSFIRPSASDDQLNRRVHEYPRLTHYIQEPVASESYFDNMSLSADGRLICYPLKRSIRLITFSPECSEMPVPWCRTETSRLHVLKTHVCHKNPVLCTKFSPTQYLLVSGCMGGELNWYEPVV